MRLDVDNSHYIGSPLEIVTEMRSVDHGRTRDLDALMKRIGTSFGMGEIAGDTLDDRCEQFVAQLVRKGIARGVFVADSPDSIDRWAIRVLRSARGVSREKLAQEIGVSTMTINRWENGDNEPDAKHHPAIVKALFEPRYRLQAPVFASAAREPAATYGDVRSKIRAQFKRTE